VHIIYLITYIGLKTKGVIFLSKKDMFSDLHTHTTASDGQYSPSQLVRLAALHGLDILAITDHDTIDGLDEGIAAGQELGITVVRGIELSAKEYPTFHILGYNFSPDGAELNKICQEMKREREIKKYKIIDFLKNKGAVIPLSEVEYLAGGVIGKPHFARILVQHGYADTVEDAFNKYLNTDEYRQRIKRRKPSAKRCIEAIKAAGGKTSLAHPYQIGVDKKTLSGIVRELKGYGLDAIEVIYPKHTLEMQSDYLDLLCYYDLKGTGGSDFHGEKVKPDIQLSRLRLNLEWLFS